MPWNEQKQIGRYEVLFKDRALHDATEARAKRLGMSIGEYLQLLSRAVVLLEQGDPILVSVLGNVPALAPASTPPVTPEPPEEPQARANDPALLDSALDQMGL